MTACAVCLDDARPAEIGQACRRCHARLAHQLGAIPVLLADLLDPGPPLGDDRPGTRAVPIHDPAGRRIGTGRQPGAPADPVRAAVPAALIHTPRRTAHVTGTTAAAPVPIRIDVTDLAAPARPQTWALYARGLLGVDEDQVGTLSVATVLERLAREWATVRHESMPRTDVAHLAAWLGDRLDWACDHHPRLPDVAGEIRELHSVLVAANGYLAAPPKIMEARCPACGTRSLEQKYPGALITCATCPDVLLSPTEYADHVHTLIDAELTRRTPPMPVTGDLATIRAALTHAEQTCRWHGSDFERLGLERWAAPRCDSCKQPWRIAQALAALNRIELATRPACTCIDITTFGDPRPTLDRDPGRHKADCPQHTQETDR